MSSPSEGGKNESALHALDYFQVIKNRWKEALLVFLLVFVSCTVITRMMTPMYTSRIQFEILRPTNIINPLGSGADPVQAMASSAYMQTQFELLVSENNLKQLAIDLDLAKEWGATPLIASYRLMGMIRVMPKKGTNIIDITVTGPDKSLAKRICEAVPETYKKVRELDEKKTVTDVINSRKALVDTRRDEMERKADIVRNYIIEGKYIVNPWVTGAPDAENIQETYNQLLNKRNALTSEIHLMSVHASALENKEKDAILDYVNATSLFTAENMSSNRVRAHFDQLRTMDDDRVKLRQQGYGDKHDQVILHDITRADIKEQLDTAVLNMIKGMKNQLELKKSELANVESQLAAAKESVKSKAVEDQKMQRAVQDYLAEKSRFEKLETEWIADRIRLLTPKQTIKIYSEPIEAGAPSSPNYKLNLSVGAVVGLIAGIGVAFAYHYFDTSIKSLEEAERQLGLPVLGVIPQDAGLLIIQGGDTPDAEAYRILRTNIELRKAAFKSSIYAIVSANAGEGKTTTLSNLAYVFAQSGYSTLMIDGDLRRPRLARYAEVKTDVGISNYLTSDMELREVIFKTSVPNLFLLASGPQPIDPSGLIGSYRMDKLLQETSRRFDIILIDSPPLLGVSDASLLVNKADATLLVLQPRKMPAKALARTKQQIENVGGKVMGIVMNNVDISGDSHYQYYTTYYSYYSSQSKRKEPRQLQIREEANKNKPAAARPEQKEKVEQRVAATEQAAADEDELY